MRDCKHDSLSEEASDTLVQSILDMADGEVGTRFIAAYAHGFIDGAVGVDYGFPHETGDAEYLSAYGQGYGHGKEAATVVGQPAEE